MFINLLILFIIYLFIYIVLEIYKVIISKIYKFFYILILTIGIFVFIKNYQKNNYLPAIFAQQWDNFDV